MLTPEEFYREMKRIVGDPEGLDDVVQMHDDDELSFFLDRLTGPCPAYSESRAHIETDQLIIVLLKELGYVDGARVFDCMSKWYE